MKPLVRLAIPIVTLVFLAGCTFVATDSSSVTQAPVRSTASRVLSTPATNLATPAPSSSAPLAVSRQIPVAGDPPPADAVPSRDMLDIDRQAVQEMRMTPKTPRGVSTPSKSPDSAARVVQPIRPFEGPELYVHIPPQTKPQQPLRVLLVLHGMGNSGEPFSQNLIKEAEHNNWLLIAPTLAYRDYMDPKLLKEDDLLLGKRILDTLDVLPQRLNLKLHQHILIYGFSRGAQLAHRFAYFYPERVESVVTLSAGAYTLPTEKRPGTTGVQVIPFPYGIGDLQECVGQPINWQALKKISFWIGVGEQDTQANEVPRAFDPYVGTTRVERARAFQQALQALSIDAHLVIFPDATHEVTPQMRTSALQFLHDDELTDHWDD